MRAVTTPVRFIDQFSYYYLGLASPSPSLSASSALRSKPTATRITRSSATTTTRRAAPAPAPVKRAGRRTAVAAAAAAAAPKRAPAARAAAPAARRKAGLGAGIFGGGHESKADDLMKGVFHLPARLRPDSGEANVEICFSFDTTGSMNAYVNEVKQKIEQSVLQLLGDLPNIRISIIAHGDYCDHHTYVLKRLDLSNDRDAIPEFVRGVEATGGGDGDECYELVLKEAQGLSWTPGSAKALVVIGDAAPHRANQYFNIDWKEELERLKALGVKVYGVRCGHSAEKFYEAIADETGGATLELANLQGITEMVMGLCYREAAFEHARRREAMEAVAAAAAAGESSTSAEDKGKEKEAAAAAAVAGPSEDAEMMEAPEGMLIDEEAARVIHKAIHEGERRVTVHGKEHEICIGYAGCRFVKIGAETYIEQNKDKSSKYARMAIEGRKITWIIREGKWGLIMDENPKVLQTEAARDEA